ncbi:MAG: alpha/beta hydrolase [Bacteroidales bacterium]|nr:alpha/beta hydrolase [Bacteroidales bacterium]
MKKFNLNLLTIFAFMLISSTSYSQIKKTIYFIPGQGSDKRIFADLTLDSSYNYKFLDYNTPDRKLLLSEFAKQIATSIDSSEKFILIGVSLGGMICAELNEILNPEKVIIISSAKNRMELPFRYKFQRIIPLFEIFPARVLFWGAKILQPIVESDRNKNKDTFKSMLFSKNPTYIKRTIRLIINWKRTSNSKEIIHIHGTNDHTLPFKNISNPDYVIKNGSHMMTLTRADEISKILNKILSK